MNDQRPLPPSRTLLNISWRYLRGHLWQGVLMVIGVALGVAVMVGVDLANQSASRAFQLSTDALTGRATHYLSAGSRGIEEEVYVALRREGLEVPAAPVITAYVSSPRLDGITLQALGLDPFVEAPFRDYLASDEGELVGELEAFLTTPGGVIVSRELADRFQLGLGSSFPVEFAGETHTCTVVGLLDTRDALNRRALAEMLLMDLATAQEITGKVGRLDRVDLILPDEDPAPGDRLQERLPSGVRVQPVEARTGTVEEMTRAFQVNLTALSLLAMVVALFLIYNTITFSVTRRRAMFGTLRALGLTRGEIFWMVIAEAAVVGVLGAVLGLLLGVWMGRGTVNLVTRTINDLFFVTTVRDIPLPWISLIKGFLIGLAGTVGAAVFPAREAVHAPPRAALSRADLEEKVQQSIPWVALGGGLLGAVGGGILFIPTENLAVSFGAAFLVVLGLALLTPQVTVWLMRAAGRITGPRGPVGRMAPREVVNAISRTSVAVAALMIAVSVTIGVSLMINSFRSTVVTWLDQILQGDIYVSVPGAGVSQPTYLLQPEAIEILEGWEGAARVDLLQTAQVNSPRGPIQVSASSNPNDGLEQIYQRTEMPPEQIWGALQEGGVLVSEPLANRLDLPAREAELPLYTDRGLVRFPVVGVYYDYSSTQGNALLSLDVYRRYWEDRGVSAASLVLEPGQDPVEVTRALQSRLREVQQLLIRPNRDLRAETLVIFDRTFAITGTLQVMTTVVAFFGVLSAMMSLQLEKGRQYGILRAVGFSGRQLWRLVLLETGLMGMVAGLLAMPTGYVLSLILIYIINLRSFGWTLMMEVTPGPFLAALGIAVAASLLAGLYPARRILQRSTAEAIRFE